MSNTKKNPAATGSDGDAVSDSAGAPTVSAALEQLVSALESSVVARVAERSSPAEGVGIDPSKAKEMLAEIVQSVLFDSGILEKFVSKKIEEGGGGLSKADAKSLVEEALAGSLEEQLKSIVDKQVRIALAGEDIKLLIDDKFRAISLYLKSDVIPKTVKQVLVDMQQTA